MHTARDARSEGGARQRVERQPPRLQLRGPARARHLERGEWAQREAVGAGQRQPEVGERAGRDADPRLLRELARRRLAGTLPRLDASAGKREHPSARLGDQQHAAMAQRDDRRDLRPHDCRG